MKKIVKPMDSLPVTMKAWAVLAQKAYSTVPDIGQQDSAARIIFNNFEEGLVLSIPGTNNQRCFLADIEAIPQDVGNFGKVHKGIWEAFDQVWNDVSKLDIHSLVGHSEGALGAIFIAARLCLLGKPPKQVHAWEPPKGSIDNNLKDIFTKYGVAIYCYKHGNDIIPSMPMSTLLFPWRHPCDLDFFGESKFPILNLTDHFIQNIIDDL